MEKKHQSVCTVGLHSYAIHVESNGKFVGYHQCSAFADDHYERHAKIYRDEKGEPFILLGEQLIYLSEYGLAKGGELC